MTMQFAPHPDDERLAAYAGADPDALADRTLVAHLATCERCRPLVDELSLLRGALAELPDIVPSRPLRLIPPVVAPPTPARDPWSWLRRVTAPAMVVGAGLVLVGAIGVGRSGGVSAIFANVGEDLKGGGQETSETARQVPAGADSPSLVPGDTSGGPSSGKSPVPGSVVASPAPGPSSEDAGDTSSEQPWLTLLIAGVGLFGISAALRFSISPRAG